MQSQTPVSQKAVKPIDSGRILSAWLGAIVIKIELCDG